MCTLYSWPSSALTHLIARPRQPQVTRGSPTGKHRVRGSRVGEWLSSHSAPVQVFQRHRGSTWPGPGWFSSPGCPVSCFLAYTAHPTSCLLACPFLDIQVSGATCLTMPPALPSILVAWRPSPRPQTAVPPRRGSSPPAAASPRCPPRRRSPRPGTSTTVPGSSGAPAWTSPARTWNPLTGWRGCPCRTPAPQRKWTTSPLSM